MPGISTSCEYGIGQFIMSLLNKKLTMITSDINAKGHKRIRYKIISALI